MTVHDTIERPTGAILCPAELLAAARRYAGDARVWAERSDPPIGRRTYGLLDLTDDVEIWAIRWPAGGTLELHDHGGSAGALFVIEGNLQESFVTALGHLGRRRIRASSGTAFGPGYIHDVTNPGPTATSVHAYSPPMTFYRATADGPVAVRTEYRSDPSWAP